MAVYRLRVNNNSGAFENFAVYQADPDLGLANVMSLAWFVEGAHPTQSLYFEWQINYSVMWSDAGAANGTVQFQINQEVPCDPQDTNNNGLQLSYQDNVPLLEKSKFALGTSKPGSIYVNELSNLPDDAGMIGLAVSGSPAYCAPAAPNRLEVMTPHPNYWITAGNFAAGVSLDVEEVSSHSQQLSYDDGIFDLTVDYSRGRSWSVTPTVTGA